MSQRTVTGDTLHISRSSRRTIGLFLLAIFAGGFARNLPSVLPFEQLSGLIYAAVLIAWGVTIENRILDPDTRRWLLRLTRILIAYIFIRQCKYMIFDEIPVLQMYMWYLYLPCNVLAARCCLECSHSVAHRRTGHLPGPWLVEAIVLLICLTNNRHQLVYRFAAGEPDPLENYSPGVLYLCIIAWIVLVLFLAFRMLLAEHRGRRETALLPLLPLMILAGWMLVYYANQHVAPNLFMLPPLFNAPEMFVFGIMGFMEGCIQIGLIASNTGYRDIAGISSLVPVFLNADDTPAVLPEGRPMPGREQILRAKEGGTEAGEGRILYARAIQGGTVLYEEDLREIRRLNRALKDAADQLTEENEVLRTEHALEEQRIRLEVQNRLYDSITEATAPQLGRIEELARNHPDERKALALASFYGAYIKRRANLMLLASGQEKLPLGELWLSARESMEYLRLTGASTAAVISGQDAESMLPSGVVLAGYIFLENVLECASEQLSAAHVRIGAGGRVRVELSGYEDDAAARIRQLPAPDHGTIRTGEDDGVLYVDFIPKPEEDAICC